jgi:hypothetical protein
MSKLEFYCVSCEGPIQGGAWVHPDGELTHVGGCKAAYEESLYIHECPKCEGRGYLTSNDRTGLVVMPGVFIKACPLCEGRGGMKNKPIPIDWKLGCE